MLLSPLGSASRSSCALRLEKASAFSAHALDGGDELLVAEGLQQIVRRAEAERRAGIVEVVVGGEHDDVSGAAALAQDAHHLDAVHVRHPHVGDDEVGAVALGRRPDPPRPLAASPTTGTAERGPVDAEHDAAAHHGLVVNDQYLEHGPLLSASGAAAARSCRRPRSDMRSDRSSHRSSGARCGPRCSGPDGPPGISSWLLSRSSTSGGMPLPLSDTLSSR